MPRVEIVQKHNTAARRLYIRGHNGKVCAENNMTAYRHYLSGHKGNISKNV